MDQNKHGSNAAYPPSRRSEPGNPARDIFTDTRLSARPGEQQKHGESQLDARPEPERSAAMRPSAPGGARVPTGLNPAEAHMPQTAAPTSRRRRAAAYANTDTQPQKEPDAAQPPRRNVGGEGLGAYAAPAAKPDGARVYAVPQATRSAAPEEQAEDRQPDDREANQPRHGGWKKGRYLLIAAAAALALLLVAYFVGPFGRGGDAVSPDATANAELPSVFEAATGTPGSTASTITPAQVEPAAEMLHATVAPAEAEAPATLVFTLETNAATTAVRLMDDNERILRVNTVRSAQGDGLLWKITAQMESAYTGTVRFFLRDSSGIWTEGDGTCAVSVR